MITQRFNSNKEWWGYNKQTNSSFMGLVYLINDLVEHFQYQPDTTKKMIEIGAYMGESTFLFACSGIFKEIDTIDPHSGREEFNEMFGYSWDDVKSEFEKNTRHFDNIVHHKDFSYNIVDNFDDKEYDFVYIDANHTYESIKQDLELYLPKVRSRGVISGHDYTDNWVGVRQAVDETFGSLDKIYTDGSWIKYL